MLAGMDDREDPEDLITMEAMSGLARIFAQIDEGHVRPILINIALRIRPCFEKVSLLYCQGERERGVTNRLVSANPCSSSSCIHIVWQFVSLWEWTK